MKQKHIFLFLTSLSPVFFCQARYVADKFDRGITQIKRTSGDKSKQINLFIKRVNNKIAEGKEYSLSEIEQLYKNILELQKNHAAYLQKNSAIADRLTNLEKQVKEKVDDLKILLPLPSQDNQSATTPPPLPPRDHQTIPTPPPLPPVNTQSSTDQKKGSLLNEINKGITLKPIPELPEVKGDRDKLLKDIQKKQTLKPVSDRQLPEIEKEETVLDQIKSGITLKPSVERELKPKPEREKSEREKLREQIRQGIELKPVGSTTEKPKETTDFAAELKKRRQAFADDEEDTIATIKTEKKNVQPKQDATKSSSTKVVSEEKPRPTGDRGSLLESIRAGKELKKTSGPIQKTSDSSNISSFEKAILGHKKESKQSDVDSEYEEGEWD